MAELNTEAEADLLVTLSDEEFAKLPQITQEEVFEALRQGEEQRKAVEDAGTPTMTLPNMLFR